jgi:hypothetical protein
VAELRDQLWARPLLDDINANGGMTRENKGRLFELRFAYALHRAGIAPEYAVPGEAGSSLDFGFAAGNRNWRVELMRLAETEAAQHATHTSVTEDGVIWSAQVIGGNAADPRQSEEGETIKAVQRICQKCERGGHPHRFPMPDDTLHAILVDFRTFLHGGDDHDRIHVGLGGEYVRDAYCRRYWEDKLISGAFSARTTVRGAAQLQERVHFIGFVDEGTYGPDQFAEATQFVANPASFSNADEMRSAIDTWPLLPALVLNGG